MTKNGILKEVREKCHNINREKTLKTVYFLYKIMQKEITSHASSAVRKETLTVSSISGKAVL